MRNINIEKYKFFFLILFIIQLIYIFHFRSDFKYEILKNSFSKNFDNSYAVSSEVLESKSILTKNNYEDFNISDEIRKNTYLYQRFIEFNYPLRINTNSEIVFFLKNENLNPECKIIETGQFLKLTNCNYDRQ